MRGRDRQYAELFSYVGIEARLRPDHPMWAIRMLVDEALEVLSPAFSAIYDERAGRPSIRPERLLRANAPAGVLFGAVRAPAHGTPRLRSSVPLVRRLDGRRAGLERLDFLEEPRAAAERSDCGEILRCRSRQSTDQAAALYRALQR